MTVINIEVIFDFVCVWCYISKRKLEKAIELHQKTYPGGKDDEFRIKWRSYYLDYNPFPYSIEKSEMAESRLGGMNPEKRSALFQRMETMGQAVGIHFNWGGRIGNTRDAHRLVHISGTKSVEAQSKLVANIFEAYHEREMDISEQLVLHQLAEAAGFDGEEVKGWLKSNRARESTDAEAARYEKMLGGTDEVPGVPTFIIQGRYRVDGAQEPPEFMVMFAKIKEKEARAN